MTSEPAIVGIASYLLVEAVVRAPGWVGLRTHLHYARFSSNSATERRIKSGIEVHRLALKARQALKKIELALPFSGVTRRIILKNW
jgi:hypothetical protein